MSAVSPPPTPLARRAAVLALLAAFLLAQTLGWIHRGMHAAGAPAHERSAVTAVAAAAAGNLFAHDAGSNECRVYDALGHADCAPAPVLALPVLPPAAVLAATLGEFVARRAALFDARGPPPSR